MKEKAFSHRRPGGLSLIELIITIAILSIIALGASQIFIEGLRLFRTNQKAAEAQASVLKTLSKISTEVVNADTDLIEIYDDSSVPGIVFASPLDSNGNVHFHPENGRVFWQKYVCYYLTVDPDDPSQGELFRVEEAIANNPLNPSGETGDSRIFQLRGEISTKTTTFFQNDKSLPRRLLGSKISSFTVREFDGTVSDNEGGSRETLGGSSITSRNQAIDVILEAGDQSDRGPDGYYLRVDSRVAPRG